MARRLTATLAMTTGTALLVSLLSGCGGDDDNDATWSTTTFCLVTSWSAASTTSSPRPFDILCKDLQRSESAELNASELDTVGRQGSPPEERMIALIGCPGGSASPNQWAEVTVAPAGPGNAGRPNPAEVLASCAEQDGLSLPTARSYLTDFGPLGGQGQAGPAASSVSCMASPDNPYGQASNRSTMNPIYRAVRAIFNLPNDIANDMLDRKAFDLVEGKALSAYEAEKDQVIEDASAEFAAFFASWEEDAAETSAADAAIAADAAAGWASVSSDPDAKVHAAKAADHATNSAAAAHAAAVAAEVARGPNVSASKAIEAWAQAQEAAARADAEAKKAVEEARKAEEAAKRAPAPTEPTGNDENRITTDDMLSPCQALSSSLRRCEAAQWRTSDCELLLAKLRGCSDPEITDPRPEGPVLVGCPDKVELTAEELNQLLLRKCSSALIRTVEDQPWCIVGANTPANGTWIIAPCAIRLKSACPDPLPEPTGTPDSPIKPRWVWCPPIVPNMPILPCIEGGPSTGPGPPPVD